MDPKIKVGQSTSLCDRAIARSHWPGYLPMSKRVAVAVRPKDMAAIARPIDRRGWNYYALGRANPRSVLDSAKRQACGREHWQRRYWTVS